MSRKGAPSACKSKQIPRIFQSRRVSCSGRSWTAGEHDIVESSLDYGHSELLTGSPDEDKREETSKKEKQRAKITVEGVQYTERTWDQVGNQPVNGRNSDAETVADIEKWLKTRTESVSSMDLDAIKSEVEEGVDRYLGEELQHAFLEKDPDALSIDIDLSDKKLNLAYDPILHELENEKLLEACDKDEFILPEFQLDHLDPLALSPGDMMVAGEILPSTSVQPVLSTPSTEEENISAEEHRPDTILLEEQDSCSKSTQVAVDDLHNIEIIDSIEKIDRDEGKVEVNINAARDTSESYMQDVTTTNVVNELSSAITEIGSETMNIEELKAKAKVKLEPRIIKKHRKLSSRLDKIDKEVNNGNLGVSQDGVMAVVAISTDKISNMTQIVINTGTEEQIYQGKTSELIEATGNFPKLPKLETTTAWNGPAESNVDSTSINQHEIVISNALEELGITDDTLQPISITEHGKVWLCPKEDCNRQFSKLYALKGHLLAHYGVRPFKCDFEGCTWAFYSEFKLKRHKETHLKRKDYVCEVEGCNRRFTTIYNLWSHEKLHSRPNRIVCQVPDCQEKFQTKRALELHMKSHDQSHAPYICKHEGCGKRYYSSNALTSHQRCHSYKEIDVKCSWPSCGKVFDKPCRLKAHIRSHTGCKPYLCTFQGCQWAFSSSSKLKRHQKKHTNERKFVCDVPSCGKAFMRSEHLKEHRLTHNEGRYFQCYMCDARFSAKSSLYVHIKKHQTKDDPETSDPINVQKRIKAKETHCSRVNPIVKSKRKSVELSIETACLTPSPIEQSQPDDPVLSENMKNLNTDETAQLNQTRTLYHCPVETCTRSYSTKATLRAHMLKVHGTPVGDCDKSLNNISGNPPSNMDYILYTTASTVPKPTEQMILATACDTVILSTSPQEDRCLPEAEPSVLTSPVKNPEVAQENLLQRQSPDHHQVKKDQGSARTGLTFSDVWKLKANGALLDSVVGASDVVLGTSDLGEGLLLTEELPSMYYQDDVVGTEYQVLLLDSGPSESTINLRGLE